MDYQQLADQLFPDVTDTMTDLEKRYPSRDLAEGLCHPVRAIANGIYAHRQPVHRLDQ